MKNTPNALFTDEMHKNMFIFQDADKHNTIDFPKMLNPSRITFPKLRKRIRGDYYKFVPRFR